MRHFSLGNACSAGQGPRTDPQGSPPSGQEGHLHQSTEPPEKPGCRGEGLAQGEGSITRSLSQAALLPTGGAQGPQSENYQPEPWKDTQEETPG